MAISTGSTRKLLQAAPWGKSSKSPDLRAGPGPQSAAGLEKRLAIRGYPPKMGQKPVDIHVKGGWTAEEPMMSDSLPKTISSPFRVAFHDCDPFGHLNNAAYVSHFIEARTSQIRDFYNYDVYEDAKTTGKNWVVGHTEITYLAPIRMNETAVIETRLLASDARRLKPEGVMWNPASGRIHAIVWFDLVYVDLATGRPARHSDELRTFFSSIEDDNSEIEREDFDKRVAQLVRLHRERAKEGRLVA